MVQEHLVMLRGQMEEARAERKQQQDRWEAEMAEARAERKLREERWEIEREERATQARAAQLNVLLLESLLAKMNKDK